MLLLRYSHRFLLIPALFLLGSGSYSSAQAQYNSLYRYSFFKASDGLAETWSVHASESPRGGIWISHGEIYKASYLSSLPGENESFVVTVLSSGYTNKIIEDEAGDLWSADRDNIHIYRDGEWQKFGINGEPVKNSPFTQFADLIPFMPLSGGRLMYLLPGTLSVFDLDTREHAAIIDSGSLALGDFIDFASFIPGTVWLSAENGIARIDLADELLVKETVTYPLREKLALSHFDALTEYSATSILAVGRDMSEGQGRLVRYNGKDWNIVTECKGDIVRGWPGIEDSYWIWKNDDSLSFVHKGVEIAQDRSGMLAGDFKDVLPMKSGGFWLCTSHGMVHATPQLWRTPGRFLNTDRRVSSIFLDSEQRLWFGAEQELLCLDAGKWSSYPLPEGKVVSPYSTQAICELPDGRLAIGEPFPPQESLLFFDPRTNSFSEVRFEFNDSSVVTPDNIGLIAPKRDGNIWVQIRPGHYSHEFKLMSFDGEEFTPVLDMGEQWNIGGLRYIHESPAGNLWLGGLSGSGIGMYKDGQYRTFDEEDGYGAGGAFAIAEMTDGRIWVGGRDAIYEYDGREWRLVKDAFATVRSICPINSNEVWVASDNGLHRYYHGAWIRYTSDDGLPNSAAFSVASDYNGRIWAGTISGLSAFHPNTDPHAPETVLSRAKNPSEVPHDGDVRFLFSGVDQWKQSPADRLLFSYRLDGGEWTEFSNDNLAEYQGLEHGEHVFEVRAMDLNLNQDTTPASLQFSVLRPWYMEPGFQIILGISALIITLMGFATYRSVILQKLVTKHAKDLQDTNVKLKSNVQELRRTERKLKKEHSLQQVMLNHERLLARVASIFNSTDSFYDILDELMRIMGRSLGVGGVSMFQFAGRTDEKMRFLAAWRSPKVDASQAYKTVEMCLEVPEIRNTIEDAKVMVSEDISEFTDEPRFMGAVFILPIKTLRRVEGVICFYQARKYRWKPTEMNLFPTIADMVANAWQRYFHYQERLEADRKKTEAFQIAERAGRMASIGVMAAGIVHEINQPLNAIKITTDAVSIWNVENRHVLPAGFSDRLSRLSGCVEKIDEIIRHMRSFWISPGQMVTETFDLAEGIGSALSLLERQLQSHGIELEIISGLNQYKIRGNRIHLEQIIINLVVNAMHALDASGLKNKRIVIKIYRMLDDAVIEIIDNGPGLPADTGDRIFDPFFSTKKPGEGTGLGLAIVKRFVEGFGGSVSAENNEFGGALFRLRLPVCHAETETEKI